MIVANSAVVNPSLKMDAYGKHGGDSRSAKFFSNDADYYVLVTRHSTNP